MMAHGALAATLVALQSLIDGVQLERAARAAIELIRASGRLLSSLASNPAFRDIAVFPVTEEPGDARRILSLGDLANSRRVHDTKLEYA
jgi:isocitrate lyase